MLRSSDIAIALFAKAPRTGRVKTRLARDLSPRVAAEFHRLCTRAMWERIAAQPSRDAFFYCDIRWPEFEALAGRGRFRLQRGAGLGARMRHCLGELLAAGYGKALIVGSDAPAMPAAQIDEAVAELDAAEVALGPAEDGGFTLIGATRVAAAMFRGVTWSAADTRKACLAAAEAAGLRAAETRSKAYDVDTLPDFRRLARETGLPASLKDWLQDRRNRRSK